MPDTDPPAVPDAATGSDPAADPAPGRPGWSRRRTWATVVAAALLLPLLAGLGVATWLWVTTDVPPPGSVRNPEASVLRYEEGAVLARVGSENRISVDLDAVSEAARLAVLAAEDREFYDSSGISLTGILRAAWSNLRSGEVRQGGSTITQQYARNAYLTQERTWSRKARELVIALKLDRTRTKDEVLERYLNTVYFGRGAYGIETASRTFFGKPAASLTAAEGAVLASQLRSPSGYDPATHPQRARERWEYVLDGMREQGWLDQPREPVAYPRVLPRQEGANTLGGPDGYLVRTVLDELEELGFPEADVNVGGYVVDTTFDRRAQQAAGQAVRDVTGEQAPPDVYRALVSVEPGTGRVRAMYGGADYVARPFNAATQGTALAGSSFKPYVLAAALQQGISLRTRFDGRSPQTFGDYEVKNYGRGDGEDFGRIDLVTATEHSVNTVFVPLGLSAGTERVADTAAALGVTSDMSRERTQPSISLGVTAVTPLDQATAYATLAAGGVHADPFVVERVTGRDGEVLYEADPKGERVLPADVAADVTFALEHVVEEGTGAAAGRLVDRPAAGKTGTTSDNTAAWFVGYTPRLATAVALYSADQGRSMPAFGGVREVTGGSLPAVTWGRYTAAALEGTEPAPFPEPAFVGERLSPSPSPAPSKAPATTRTSAEPAPTTTSPTPSPTSTPTSPAASASEQASPSPTPSEEGPLEPVPDEVVPTTEPTAEPTSEPTTEPTSEPTSQPTSEPTSQPTSQPVSDATSDAATGTADPSPEPDPAAGG